MPLELLLTSGTPLTITRWAIPFCTAPPSRLPSSARTCGTCCATCSPPTPPPTPLPTAPASPPPQVGADLAVFVYDCLDGFGRRRQGLVCNPQISLAVQPAICRGQDQFGDPVAVKGTSALARCLQHETDHVDSTRITATSSGSTSAFPASSRTGPTVSCSPVRRNARADDGESVRIRTGMPAACRARRSGRRGRGARRGSRSRSLSRD